VVIKPSEITPLTALKLAELAKDIFPAGVLNVLFGRGKTVGDPLTGHEKVRMVSLTGSIATGNISSAIRPRRLNAPIWSWAAKRR
jgi:aminobutyraldehyde dehydrogenase